MILTGLTTAFVVPGSGVAAPSSSPKKWIVVLKPGTNPDTVAKSVGAAPSQRYSNAFSGFASELTEAQLRKLDGDSRVLSLNENKVLARREPLRATPFSPSDFTTEAIPPGHPAQFVTNGVRRIGGLESPTANIDNEPDPMKVDIAVIDTGVAPHLDLNIVGGADCHAGTGFDDTDGHGTLVAGFAAAKDNDFGAVGVAPGARIWAVRIADPDGTITDENVLCGLDFVQRNGKIEVVNMSFSDDGTVKGPCGVARKDTALVNVSLPLLQLSIKLKKHQVVDPFHAAICKLNESGVTLVAAAGNESVDTATKIPAAYPEVIAVSALSDLDGEPGGVSTTPTCLAGETDDTFASFSNFGKPVDIAAPGVCITSTFLGNSYVRVSGTSFAAPLVAGGAALLKVRHPNWSPKKIRKHIIKTAEPGPIPGDPDDFPEGILDVSTF